MWSSAFLAEACAAKVSGPAQNFTSVSTDSRTVEAGALYVALSGDNFDGHRFVEQAVAAGASGVLVSQRVECDRSVTMLQVSDTLKALQAMAHVSRLAFDGPVIAVTGSNGKTTTKEMIASVLREQYGADSVLATVGNLNNHIGVPLTLLARKPSHRVAVIEMGMNHFGEISLLTKLTEPTIAVITNAGPAHLEGVGSIEGVAAAKGEVFTGLRDGGVAVINADDSFAAYWQVLTRTHKRVSFGLNSRAIVTGQFSQPNRLRIQIESAQCTVALRQEGAHNAANALAAAAVGHALSISISAIQRGLESAGNVDGRLTTRSFVKGSTLIDDSYNANPASMRAAAQVLVSHATPRFLAIGDMGELGDASDALHDTLAFELSTLPLDGVFTLGPRMKRAASSLGARGQAFDDVESLADTVFNLLTPGATLLVKGSRSMAMERVIEKLEKMSQGTL
ncbi:MAG: UDP-N-acetylmuramoyl-tripeptide--D-alanyl-D-alanine ligase [Casimicrobium sp.]